MVVFVKIARDGKFCVVVPEIGLFFLKVNFVCENGAKRRLLKHSFIFRVLPTFHRHVLKPETTKRNDRNETTENTKTTKMKTNTTNMIRNDQNKTTCER